MNNRGQVMIEGLIIGALISSLFFFVLRYALFQYQNIIVDEFIEDNLICSAAEKTNCNENLKQNLARLNFKEISITTYKSNHLIKLKVSAISNFYKKIEKESEMQIEYQIAI